MYILSDLVVMTCVRLYLVYEELLRAMIAQTFFFALLFLQSYLVHATQLQRRPSLHIMQNWAGCAWPQRGQLYMGARRLLRKRKEEELTGLHIASPLSRCRRIYTTCKAAA